MGDHSSEVVSAVMLSSPSCNSYLLINKNQNVSENSNIVCYLYTVRDAGVELKNRADCSDPLRNGSDKSSQF